LREPDDVQRDQQHLPGHARLPIYHSVLLPAGHVHQSQQRRLLVGFGCMPDGWRSRAFALALLFGCQRTDSTSAPPTAAPTHAAVVSEQPKAGSHIDVHGIDVKFLAGGGIEITGRDRWNNPFDTTYENAEYFRNALPVLARSVSDQQAAGLRALEISEPTRPSNSAAQASP
jgi:hypothetical protein